MNRDVVRGWTLVALVVMTGTLFCQAQQDRSTAPADLASAELGTTRNVHACDRLFLAGQFQQTDLPTIKQAGVERIITLRTEGEVAWNEQRAVETVGLQFLSVPFRGQESLTDAVFDRIRTLLADREAGTMMHCGSANRVGAVWLPFRVLDQGVPLDRALEEAKQVGLRNPDYEAKAIDYVRRMQARGSSQIPDGINDRFVDPNLDVESFVDRFERESREVFSARDEVLRACGIQRGWRVADIGAGTGLYTRLFAEQVGPGGWVYAVDISPRFIGHIYERSKALGQSNVTGVLCREDACSLPPQSVDCVFVCDTYHHFEYPAATTQSIYQALKPGGHLIVIDFERIPGQSREWLLNHVRAGKSVFRAEIEEAGFTFVEERSISGFKENYFLRFRKD